MDRFEDNDTAATATNFGTLSGTVSESSLNLDANDPDWYRFTLGATGRATDKISVSFTHTSGDVDIALYASNGTTVLGTSAGTGNLEEISLSGLAAGTYYVLVYGFNGVANPNYALTITPPPPPVATVAPDRFEQNDTAATATNLGTLSGTVTESALTVESNDNDWYRFTLGASGRAGDKVSISFNTTLGDVDLVLYGSDGSTVVNTSTGTGNVEEISLSGLAAGTYYARVYGFNAASNPSYTLTITPPPAPVVTVAPDRFEQNDTAATATLLGTVNGTVTESSLSVESGDNDWYRFILGAAGRTGDKVSVSFNTSLGDVDLVLYGSDGSTVVNTSTGTSNLEEISLAGLAAGTYYARIYGFGTASNPSYTLAVTAVPPAPAGDRFENNDTAATATNLGSISGTATESSLSIEAGDPDWYRFSLAGPGRAGDKVSVSFNTALGDVDMVLYGGDGSTVVNTSTGTGNLEEISLTGVPAGTYYARVYGYNNASNPSYTLQVTAAPYGVTPDRFEQNDTSATATNLGTINGTVTESGLTVETNESDWYRFTLPNAARTGDKVSVSFNGALGDVDLYLYGSDGSTVVNTSAGTGNLEEISLAGLAAGTYFARVLGYNGVSNPAYTLGVTVVGVNATGDRFENNDTAATATNLGTVSGTITESSLSIEANDPDFYRFALPAAGRTGDKVTVAFNTALGDVDLYLYGADGSTVLLNSTGVGNLEEISLAGLPAGTYYARVQGYNGASNPSYTLSVAAAPTIVTPDRFEQNDTAATATDLRTITFSSTESGLSIEANDPDWYRFTLSGAGRSGDKVSMSFTHTLGDLDMVLYAGNGTTVLGSSSGAGNLEEISLAGVPAGDYFVRINGYNGASNPNYTLSITALNAGPNPTTVDRFEQNDTAATATDLRTISGTVTESGLSIEANDPDWYRFTLSNAGRAGDKVSMAFTHAQGDLDLVLFASNGTTVLGSSAGTGNLEEISLSGLAAGSYYVRVNGYNGASNPNYALSVSAAPTTVTGDRFEQNDTAATATDLRTIAGTVTESGLSIEANDPDWFRFTLGSVGRSGDKVSMAFTHTLGDLDMVLYASNGTTVLGSSAGTGNLEEIGLAGLAAGDYLLRVNGYNGASNPSYALSVTATPTTVTGDRFEQNDTAATATDLRTIAGTVTESGLSIEANDPDWFRFTLGSAGRAGDKVSIAFTHAQGDLDLVLFASNGTTALGTSAGTGNLEEINLAGLAAGDYFVRVNGYNGASNPSYALSVTATPSSITGDRFEQNDTAATATDLRTIAGTVTESGLSIEANDPDWFKFTLGAAGRSGDKVSMAFTHAQGDLDLVLFASNGTTVLGSSSGTGNLEEISLAGMAAGDYLLRVNGYNGASNPSYALSVTATASTAVTGDRFEDNDTVATATDLRTIAGTVTENGLSIETNDPDWFKFTLGAAGRPGDKLSMTFSHAQGDLDVVLYGSNGSTVVGSSTGTGNLEEVNLSGLPAGLYYARVAGYQGASNPSYTLSVIVAPVTASDDRFEQNDTAATATDLRSIAGSVVETNLAITANDPDWFRFTLGAAGRTGDKVSIAFNNALGDLDLALFSSNGTTVLGSSTGTGNAEEISLAGLAAGTYLARVAGYNGAINPNYSLTVAAAGAPVIAGDRLENNDSAATATDLRTITGTATESSLSIESNDPDWFRFTLANAGRSGDKVSISFSHSLGDLDLALFSGNGSTMLSSSAGTGNLEEISLSGLAAGTYFARVIGYGGANNPSYSLSVTAAQTTGLTADQWEANNASTQATAVRQTSQTFTGATITANDQDWYSFSLPAAGALTDRASIVASGGNLTFRLLNAQSQQLQSVQSDASGQASLGLSGLPAGQYFLNVVGASATAQAQYNLDLRAAGSGTTTTQGTWTILVYVDGDNNLEGAAIEDINEMEAALVRAGINVAVQIDRVPGEDSSNGNWTDTRRGVITPDNNASTIGSALTSIGEIDMGSGQSLTNFINWGATNLPAQNYAVVIWDHGGGTLGGSSYDDSSPGSFLGNAEVRQAIAASSLQRVDLLGFDACLMASIEIASEMSTVANRLVASEKNEPGDGWDYTAFLNQFSQAASATGTTLSTLIVDTYGASYGGRQTLSATDLSLIAPIETAIDAFVTVMRAATTADWAAVQQALTRTQAAESADLVDLIDFMTNLRTASANAAIDTAAQAVITAVQTAVYRDSSPAGFNGLTIEFPISGTTPGGFSNYTAANYRFLANTTWDDFLTLYRSTPRAPLDADGSAGLTRDARAAGDGTPDYTESLDLAGVPRSFNNDTVDTSYDLGLINQASYIVPALTIDTAADVDWFRFNIPAGNGLTPTLAIQVASASAGVTARLLNSSQAVVATATTAASTGLLTFNQLAAGGAYFLEVKSAGATTAPSYELRLNAFGSNRPNDPTLDFAETNGGNNSQDKAFQLGEPGDLLHLGAVRNLSFNNADLQSGATGGDWFRVDSARTVESNAKRVAIWNEGSSTGDLDLRVFDINGNLLAESATVGSSIEAVLFPQQVNDVFVQVVARGTTTTANYSLLVTNLQTATLEGNAGNDTLIDYSGGPSILRGLAGNDTLDGRGDIDKAVYAGTKSAHTVSKTATGWTVRSTAEGTDTLSNVERLQFSDISLALDLNGNAGTVAKVLGAVFGKAFLANETFVGIGLHYADTGMSYEALMQLALNASLGAGASAQTIVNALYTNVIGRAPSTADAAPYVALLTGGSMTAAALGVMAADTSFNTASIDLVGLTQTGIEYLPFAG